MAHPHRIFLVTEWILWLPIFCLGKRLCFQLHVCAHDWNLINTHPIIALKITNSLRCLLRAADPESSVPLCCLPLSPSNKFRSQVGRWGVSDARSAAWRPQKMTASRCMNCRILVFGLCTTADGEINAGWTNYGRFVWFPQCHVYVSLGFLLQSWPPHDPRVLSTLAEL